MPYEVLNGSIFILIASQSITCMHIYLTEHVVILVTGIWDICVDHVNPRLQSKYWIVKGFVTRTTRNRKMSMKTFHGLVHNCIPEFKKKNDNYPNLIKPPNTIFHSIFLM